MIDFSKLQNDFEVRYRFLSEAEGGRKSQSIHQGYRCDWVYAEFEEIEPNQAWIIWPLFVYESGEFVPEGDQVANQGAAHMMVVDKELRQTVHRERIRLGTKGFFVEGGKKVAEATVVRIVDLAGSIDLHDVSKETR